MGVQALKSLFTQLHLKRSRGISAQIAADMEALPGAHECSLY